MKLMKALWSYFLVFLMTTCFAQDYSGDNLPNNSTPELAKKGYEQLMNMNGKWLGKSTKDWEEEITYNTIANKSVVVEESFDAHPDETMYTMFFLDGDKLKLTHYCVSQNQPTLEATHFSEDGKTIIFTFLNATNLPSRDKGHMDKLKLIFVDDDHVVNQWTWYQAGKESWMEEIHLHRTK